MSPLIIERCSLPHRIVIRDLGDEFVAHIRVCEPGKNPWYVHGHHLKKSTAVASVAISDREAVVKAYMWPSKVNEITVPVYIRMATYKAGESKLVPDGMRCGPVVRIGTFDSPEIEMFGYHHCAGHTTDSDLDGWDASDQQKWLYTPLAGTIDPHTEDAGIYFCDICKNHCYRDDFGLRWNTSASGHVQEDVVHRRGVDLGHKRLTARGTSH
jgi:hypothetical protein